MFLDNVHTDTIFHHGEEFRLTLIILRLHRKIFVKIRVDNLEISMLKSDLINQYSTLEV